MVVRQDARFRTALRMSNGGLQVARTGLLKAVTPTSLNPYWLAVTSLSSLNPGVEVCVARCRSRPWEPEKFSSHQEQDANLENLLQWVRTYEDRTDEYGLSRHRELYERFQGKKREFSDPSDYEFG